MYKYIVETFFKSNTDKLFDAIFDDDFDKVRYLLQKGVDANATDGFYGTLHHAAWRKNIKVIELLLEKGANVNLRDSNGFTPLLIVVRALGFKYDYVELLLENGADPDIPDNEGNVPLHYTPDNQYITAKLLLEHKANPNIPNNEGDLPLYKTIMKNRIKVLDLLLTWGANPNKLGETRELPLLYASRTNNTEIVKILLKHKANPNLSNNENYVPLHNAVHYGNVEMVKLLLEHKADPNIRNHNNQNSLDYALLNNNVEIVKLLLKYNVDIPKDLRDHPIIKEIIIEYGRQGWRPQTHKRGVQLYPHSKNAIETMMLLKQLRSDSKVSELPYEMLFAIYEWTASGGKSKS